MKLEDWKVVPSQSQDPILSCSQGSSFLASALSSHCGANEMRRTGEGCQLLCSYCTYFSEWFLGTCLISNHEQAYCFAASRANGQFVL